MSRTYFSGALAALLALPMIFGAPATAHATDMVVIQEEAVANVDPETAWSRIGGFCEVPGWLPPVVGCEILQGDGMGIGTVRKLEFEDGMTVVEPLVAAGSMAYTYGMTEGFLAGTLYTATIGVSAGPDDGTSTVSWSMVMNRSAFPTAEDADNMVATLEGIYAIGIAGLKSLAEGM